MDKTIAIRDASERNSGCECRNTPNCGSDPDRSGYWDCGYDSGRACYKKEKKCLNTGFPGWEAQYCPPWGTVNSVVGVTGYEVQCEFTTINDAFEPTLSNYFTPQTINQMKLDYCNSITDPAKLLQESGKCRNIINQTSAGSTAGGDTEFDSRVLDLCESYSGRTCKPVGTAVLRADDCCSGTIETTPVGPFNIKTCSGTDPAVDPSGWVNVPDCKNMVLGAARHPDSASEGVNAGQAQKMILKYCRGGDGGDSVRTSNNAPGNHRSDPKCACVNASDLGFKGDNSCLSEGNKNLPGCDQINQKLGSFVEAGSAGMQLIQAITRDAGCLCEDCGRAEADNSDIFPYKANDADCPPTEINICDIAIEQKVSYNSPIAAQCNFSDPNAEPGSAAAGTPESSSTPGAAEDEETAEDKDLPISWAPFAKVFNTSTKQYAFLACCCVVIIILIIVIAMMMKPKNSGSQAMLLAALAR